MLSLGGVDPARARAFYADLLGLEAVMDHGWIVTFADMITLLMVLDVQLALTVLPQVMVWLLLSPVADAVTLVPAPFTVMIKLLPVPICSMVTVLLPPPM